MDINKIINDVFKIVLNILLAVIAIGAIVTGVTEDMSIGAACIRFAIAIACIATIFLKRYRYVAASIALLLIIISQQCWHASIETPACIISITSV